MDPQCAAAHPHEPPVPLNPPAPIPCVTCTLATLTNSSALPTLRRSAAATLSSLPGNPARLQRLGPSFLARTLHALLHALLTLPSTETALASDITQLLVALATQYDAREPRVVTLLFTECVAAIMLHDADLHAPFAVSLLSHLHNVCDAARLALPYEMLPSDFAIHLLSRSTGAPTVYAHATALLPRALSVADASQSGALLSAAEHLVPARSCPHADELFLRVCLHLARHEPLLASAHFQRVLNNAFISPNARLRALAADVVANVCEVPAAAERLLASKVFEYVIEGMRLPDPTREQRGLLLSSAAALASLCEAPLAERWVYALDVVLDAAANLAPRVHTILPVLCAALSDAPTPLFTPMVVDAVVGVIMRLLACGYDVMEIIRKLALLLGRFRPTCDGLHAILAVVENSAQLRPLVASVAHLVGAICKHFRCHAKQAKENDNWSGGSVLQLGRRIVFAVFHTWAGELEGTLHCYETAVSTYFSIEVIASIMDMLSAGLDPVFATAGVCDEEDRRGIQRWCWRFLPPRVAFACRPELDDSGHVRESVHKYLMSIGINVSELDLTQANEMPATEAAFLTALASGTSSAVSRAAMCLVTEAVSYEAVDGLCLPASLVETLVERLQAVETSPNGGNAEEEIVQIVTAISFTCLRYGLRLPILKVSGQAITATLKGDDFSLSSSPDLNLFRSIINRSSRDSVDVSAWDLFAGWCSLLPQEEEPVKSEGISAVENVFDEIVSHDAACQSVAFAISRSENPVRIAECLVDISERGQRACDLGRAMERAGTLHYLSEVVGRLEGSGPDEAAAASKESSSSHKPKITNVAALLWLLSRSTTFTGSEARRDLTRLVSEVFARESISYAQTKWKVALLSASVRYLTTTIQFSNDEGILSFVMGSGAASRAIRLIKDVSARGTEPNGLISGCACFLLLLLKRSRLRRQEPAQTQLVSQLLESKIQWDQLLSSLPFSIAADTAARIGNCCYLLESAFLMYNPTDFRRQSLVSENILILLSVAASSHFAFLREAATDVLGTIMATRMSEGEFYAYPSCVRELSCVLLERVCFADFATLTSVSLRYLREAVKCGHVDERLQQAHASIRKHFEKQDRYRDKEHIPSEKAAQFTDLYETVNERLKGCGDEDSRSPLSVQQENGNNQAYAQRISAEEIASRGSVFMLSRYTMTWRKQR